MLPGDPSPNVTWWRGTTVIDDDFNVTTDGFVRNELFLYKIQRTDLLVEYACRAENTHLAEPRDATVSVDINRKSLIKCIFIVVIVTLHVF